MAGVGWEVGEGWRPEFPPRLYVCRKKSLYSGMSTTPSLYGYCHIIDLTEYRASIQISRQMFIPIIYSICEMQKPKNKSE